jgi:D-arabinose 1-dehydrogenase-like Zn-dependent alcohol dehydrogenase
MPLMDVLRAMQLTAPLQPVVRPMPVPQAGELLWKFAACGVCRTDLHIIDDELPGFSSRDLWHERSVLAVAKLTRADCAGFLAVADRAGIRPQVESFALADANDAIARVRNGDLHGAAVLLPEPQ